MLQLRYMLADARDVENNHVVLDLQILAAVVLGIAMPQGTITNIEGRDT